MPRLLGIESVFNAEFERSCFATPSSLLRELNMPTNIDHIVVAAQTLEQGISYIEQQFAVTVPFGGVHPLMGTHNCLMQAGENLFFEIIAINPQSMLDAQLSIKQPRWFALDDPLLQTRLKQGPKLLTWVINSSDFEATKNTGIYQHTTAHLITRGDLSWQFALPEDGSLLAAGLLPYILQWQGAHPAKNMQDNGCTLQSITMHHPQPEWLEQQLSLVGAQHLVSINALDKNQTAFFESKFLTPKGLVTLSSQ